MPGAGMPFGVDDGAPDRVAAAPLTTAVVARMACTGIVISAILE